MSVTRVTAQSITPWKTNMDPEKHWLVEENTLPGGQTVRVYVSFRECNGQDVGACDWSRQGKNHGTALRTGEQFVLRLACWGYRLGGSHGLHRSRRVQNPGVTSICFPKVGQALHHCVPSESMDRSKKKEGAEETPRRAGTACKTASSVTKPGAEAMQLVLVVSTDSDEVFILCWAKLLTRFLCQNRRISERIARVAKGWQRDAQRKVCPKERFQRFPINASKSSGGF